MTVLTSVSAFVDLCFWFLRETKLEREKLRDRGRGRGKEREREKGGEGKRGSGSLTDTATPQAQRRGRMDRLPPVPHPVTEPSEVFLLLVDRRADLRHA